MGWKLLLLSALVGSAPVAGVAQQAPAGGDTGPGAEALGVRIVVVYDNVVGRPDLTPDWGFACVVERGQSTVLFDTGTKGEILLANLQGLGFDPKRIDAVVLSHEHGDHTGGLGALLAGGASPKVFVPAKFPQSLKDLAASAGTLVEVAGPTEVAPGLYATGALPRGFVEQALVIGTSRGLIVVTGCAHPGVEKLVARALEVAGETGLEPASVQLVLGGIHLRDESPAQVREIIGELRSLEVERVAPSHCTGDNAIAMFAEGFGSGFMRSGLGFSFSFAW